MEEASNADCEMIHGRNRYTGKFFLVGKHEDKRMLAVKSQNQYAHNNFTVVKELSVWLPIRCAHICIFI